ncbi:MAG: 6-hydroxymethylpterin diphosphokinase MptE-like protein [Candidatus Thermoplasmatota archaeon]
MLYENWGRWYKKIRQDLNLDFEKDKQSAGFLNNILKEENVKKVESKTLKKLIEKRETIVFGAGPSLEKFLESKESITWMKNLVKITADGATTALVEKEIIPDVVVTDLDGKIEDQIKANKNGSIVLIHAHGDNVDKIKRYLPCFEGGIMGTTQIDPKNFDYLYNFGGFTDGDRAVFLADHFLSKKIFLVGFDFSGKIGRYSNSDQKDKKLKLQKLEWCKKLIAHLEETNPNIEHILETKKG